MIRLSARRLVQAAGVAAILCGGLTASGLAQDIRVDSATLPIPFIQGGQGAGTVDNVLEASGVEPIGDGRLLLVAHDKVEALHVVEAATGKVITNALTCKAFPTGLKVGPKWEGMTRDEHGNFYVIGSHSGKNDQERSERAHLFRFRLTGGEGNTPISIDEGSVVRWQAGASLSSALAREVSDLEMVKKLKIEGLTLWKHRDAAGAERTELVVGLREPTDLVRTFSADITTPPPAGAELTFSRLFAFPAGSREGEPRQLTSLMHLPAWKGFLVVTATEDDNNVFHGNTLWFVSDDQVTANGGKVQAVRIYDFEVAMKCEGLCELPGATDRQVRLIATFDNDPHATKIPSRFQTITLSRRP
jgi:hypothetical protein